jgi:hypothetical protein
MPPLGDSYRLYLHGLGIPAFIRLRQDAPVRADVTAYPRSGLEKERRDG